MSGPAKTGDHISDAAAAARRFALRMAAGTEFDDLQPKGEVYSLVGAALLRTEWTTDIAVLAIPSLVVKVGSEPEESRE